MKNPGYSFISVCVVLLTFSLIAIGCKPGEGNSNNTGNQSNGNTNKTGSSGDKSGAGNSSTPAASPLPLPNALPVADSWLQTATNVRAQVGKRFVVTCSPNLKLYSVYSTGDVYYSGSSICSAAIHSGVITQAQGGQVTIEIRSAVSTSYTESAERNGVAPGGLVFNDQVDNGSFVFVKP